MGCLVAGDRLRSSCRGLVVVVCKSGAARGGDANSFAPGVDGGDRTAGRGGDFTPNVGIDKCSSRRSLDAVLAACIFFLNAAVAVNGDGVTNKDPDEI